MRPPQPKGPGLLRAGARGVLPELAPRARVARKPFYIGGGWHKEGRRKCCRGLLARAYFPERRQTPRVCSSIVASAMSSVA